MIFQHKELGELMVRQLQATDSTLLYDFYTKGLSEKSRVFFGAPYPVFSPPLDEIGDRILEWQREDDWVFLNLVKHGDIIGVAMLKRFKTHPVSGLAIRDEYYRKGLGFLLQSLINAQARLLGLEMVYATIAPKNIPSIQLH